jgi:predicted amidohydrolase
MSANLFTVGCVQVNPGEDRQANIEHAVEGVKEAVRRGAALIVLPEYATFLHASGSAMRSHALSEAEDPALPRFRQLAREHGIFILVGSLALARADGKLANRSFMISDDGEIVAQYDKLHMFDATLPGGRVIRESSAYEPGKRAVVAHTPRAQIGMSICYDLRFPALYRALSQAGAEVLAVPSAFTKATGTLHWKALLQARAIENGAYVVAAATCGSHPGGHQTFGHAMIVDPNGQILAEAGDTPEVICAEIDTHAVAAARQRIPSLTHDRAFQLERTNLREEQHESV